MRHMHKTDIRILQLVLMRFTVILSPGWMSTSIGLPMALDNRYTPRILIGLVIYVITSCSSVVNTEEFSNLAAPITDSTYTTQEQYKIAVRSLEQSLNSVPAPTPFILESDSFDFGWCDPRPSRNATLKDLTTRLEDESALARDQAQLYAATGSKEAFEGALLYLYRWASESTVFNAYELGMDTVNATFPGMEKGFCNRSWNMMLDSIWQTYGLINFSEAYSILKASELSSSHQKRLKIIKTWLKTRLVPAVNAGFHAWTKFADSHPTSLAYIRYRSDNHLSWALAGMASAGLALNDRELLDYVYYGTSYDDGVSGPYENPSSLTKLLPFAINSSGEVYDEAVRAPQHKGFFYGNFSLWALVITAINTEQAGYPPVWEEQLTPDSGTIAMALDRYAPFVSRDLPLTDPEEQTKPEFFSFIYRLVVHRDWVRDARIPLYEKAANAAESQSIRQGLGSIDLITVKPENTKQN